MVGSPGHVKLVNNAVANITRRKILRLLAEGDRDVEGIKEAVGPAMLDYHLKVLEQAKLIEANEGVVGLSEFGRNFIETKADKSVEKKIDLSETEPIEIVEVRQLIPCIADRSKFRIIARISPPLGGALELLAPLFSRGRYSERIGALIIQSGVRMINIYTAGNVTMTMIRDESEAREILEDLKKTVNDAISEGVTPAPREKVRIDPMEVNKYLPQTNCRKCGEQSCYSFAIRLMSGEVPLEKCTPLKENEYKHNLDHLQALMEYL